MMKVRDRKLAQPEKQQQRNMRMQQPRGAPGMRRPGARRMPY
jgi:hypothetical protein